MTVKDVLAIDFGTVNTYFCKCPGDQRSPKGVDFGDGRDGIATAILYRIEHRHNKPSLIGQVALDEFGDATERERCGYVLRTQFKPNIATGEEARRNAVDFLRAVLEEAGRQRLDVDPLKRQVIIGVPCEASAHYREALLEVSREAGYGGITMFDEPKGALLYHVYHRDLPATDALRGLLVVDFGGGTCDFAFLRRGNVQHSWGDMHLGGRLFDDLFFQWLVDENPGVLDMLREERSEYFVSTHLCRETKEYFSRTMARDRSERMSKAVRHYGRIEEMTWESFVQRASTYSVSETLRGFLEEIDRDTALPTDNNGPFDLLERFRHCLADGLRSANIDRSDIRSVILAGGSSLWPFVPDILVEELGIEWARIMRSDRPYAVIAEGLALQPALQRKCRATQNTLRKQLPEFCKQDVKSLLDVRTQGCAQEIAESIVQELFDKKLRPMLIQFRDEGGSVAALEERLTQAVASLQPRTRTVVEEKLANYAKGISRSLHELVESWVQDHGVVLPEERNISEGLEGETIGVSEIEIPDLYGQIIRATGAVTGSAIAIIAAKVCGGGGIALIASGPIGWIAGLILGAAVSFLTLRFGVAKAKQMAKEWEVPPLLLKKTITDARILKMREKMVADMQLQVQPALSEMEGKLTSEVSDVVNREIDALSDINHIG